MEREGDQVDLLIALLIRFPQISTVYFEPEEKVLRLVFLVKDTKKDFYQFAQVFESHLALLYNLEEEEVSVASLTKTENSRLTSIEVSRDLASLSLGELKVMTQVILDYYGEQVVQDGPEMQDEDEYEQSVLIESLLMSSSWRNFERLTGFRENGRVLVFSIPLAGVSEP